MSKTIVEIEGLRKSYGDHTVLDGITMHVNEGSIAALLGPNGAGKTTLVRILSTLVRPDGGRAIVGGYDVTANPQAVRSITGLTGQYAAVDELLTGEENLRLAARLWRIDKKERDSRMRELLERFELIDAARTAAGSYSGGMRRKLDLAMSLVGQPRILFLDEPTTGLDPRSRNALWDIVRDLARDGVTIFLTTQYLEEADQLADTITVMDNGRVIAEGPAEHLKAEVGQHVVEFWFPNGSAICHAHAALKPHWQATVDIDHTLRIPTTGNPDEIYRLLDTLHRSGIPVDRMALHRPTLDDVFLSLTSRVGNPLETVS